MATRQSPSCGVCGVKMMKNGYTSAGKRRWRCRCGASQIDTKPGKTRLAHFTSFLNYLLGKLSQGEISGTTGRGLRRRWVWCWKIPTPDIEITGKVYDQVFIDGIYLTHTWCLLIAHNGTHVVAWQWVISVSQNTKLVISGFGSSCSSR